MKGFISLVCSLAVFQTLAAGAGIPRYFERSPTTHHQLDVEEVREELGSRVSRSTAIFGPDDRRFNNATSRWNIFAVPQIQVVIVPGEESDVSTIVSAMIILIEVLFPNGNQGQILQRKQHQIPGRKPCPRQH
jgi:hypothetical protein